MPSREPIAQVASTRTDSGADSGGAIRDALDKVHDRAQAPERSELDQTQMQEYLEDIDLKCKAQRHSSASENLNAGVKS